jgi:hypothetical protein
MQIFTLWQQNIWKLLEIEKNVNPTRKLEKSANLSKPQNWKKKTPCFRLYLNVS